MDVDFVKYLSGKSSKLLKVKHHDIPTLNEQHRILAENVEDYLAPIYRSEAEYVVVLLSTHYPKKIWTKFESEQFKTRFGENKIIPIWYSDTDISIFDETRKYGGYQFDVTPECFEAEADEIVELIAKKIEETRA